MPYSGPCYRLAFDSTENKNVAELLHTTGAPWLSIQISINIQINAMVFYKSRPSKYNNGVGNKQARMQRVVYPASIVVDS